MRLSAWEVLSLSVVPIICFGVPLVSFSRSSLRLFRLYVSLRVLACLGLLTIASSSGKAISSWVGTTVSVSQPVFTISSETLSQAFFATIGALATINFSGISRPATSSTRSSSRIPSRVRRMLWTWRHLSLLACHQYQVTLLFPLLFARLPW